MAKVLHKGHARDLGDRPGHFDPGGTAPDDHESQSRAPHGIILGLFGDLESEQHPAADFQRIVETLQPGGQLLPFVVAKVGVPRPGGDDEKVVGDFAVAGHDLFPVHVDALRFGENDLGIFLRADDVAQRLGDVRRRKRGRGHLVKQRLEEMMILPVEQRDADIGLAQRLGRLQPAKAAADDDDTG